MKFATVRDLKNKTSEMLRKAADGDEVLITSHGKPIAVLHGLSEDEIDDYVLAHHPLLRKSIEDARRDLKRGKGIPLERVLGKLRIRAAQPGRRRARR